MSRKRFRVIGWAVVVVVVAGLGAYALRLQRVTELTSEYMIAAERAVHEGDLPAAETLYKRALEVNSRFLPARSGLADLYASNGEEAKSLAEHRRGIEADPGNPEAYAVLARALMGCERYGSAIERLKQGIRVAPRDTHMRLMLASCYRRAGDTEHAKAELAAIERLDPGSHAVKNARRAIARNAMATAAKASSENAGRAKREAAR